MSPGGKRDPSPTTSFSKGIGNPATGGWAAFLQHAEERSLAKGTVLFNQGDRHTVTYLIKRGFVRTFYTSPSGKEMTLAYWSEGDLVGGPYFFTPAPHMWSATAVSATVVLAINGAKFHELVREHPDLVDFAISILTHKISWLSSLLQIMGTESVTDRLAHLLIKLGDLYGRPTEGGLVIKHRFSQEELGNMVGASRQWVNMTLQRLQRAGLISVTNRQITLRDPDALRATGLIALDFGQK